MAQGAKEGFLRGWGEVLEVSITRDDKLAYDRSTQPPIEPNESLCRFAEPRCKVGSCPETRSRASLIPAVIDCCTLGCVIAE